LALFLLAAAPTTAQTPRAPSIETPEEAARSEKALEANPEDVAARDRLLAYYSIQDPMTKAIRVARRRHILWLIGHHPDFSSHNHFTTLIPPPPNRLADPEGESEGTRLWREQATHAGASSWAISHAVEFLFFHDREFALKALEEARQNKPSDGTLAWTKGMLNALTITGATAVDGNGDPAKFDRAMAGSPAADRAREELSTSDNVDLLKGAAQSVLRQFRPLFAVRPEFASLMLEMAEGWIQRMVAMRPDDVQSEDLFAMLYLQASNFVSDEAQRVRLIEMAAAHARSSEWRVAALDYVVEFHLEAGDGERARREAEEMLRKAPDMYAESSRTYATHIAHTVLGRIALQQGRLAEAREQLMAAGKVASADGIRWSLASDLLARGERDTVLEYISMVRPIWKKGKGQLDDWAKSIRAGETVDFGARTIDPGPRLIGKPAPDFRLRSVDGQQVVLSSYKGKLVLLDFWATWCIPCRAELPIFEKLHHELTGKDAAIVTVDVGEKAETVGKYVRHEQYTFPVLLDEEHEVEWQYRLSLFPSLVVIDKQGRVTDFIAGAQSEVDLRAALERARSGN
jgi:thiol-disulfide isomerase/thioredoxin